MSTIRRQTANPQQAQGRGIQVSASISSTSSSGTTGDKDKSSARNDNLGCLRGLTLDDIMKRGMGTEEIDADDVLASQAAEDQIDYTQNNYYYKTSNVDKAGRKSAVEAMSRKLGVDRFVADKTDEDDLIRASNAHDYTDDVLAGNEDDEYGVNPVATGRTFALPQRVRDPDDDEEDIDIHSEGLFGASNIDRLDPRGISGIENLAAKFVRKGK